MLRLYVAGKLRSIIQHKKINPLTVNVETFFLFAWIALLQKAVRVTTIMKRLRAPEHHQTAAAAQPSEGAANPAGGAQENPQAPAEASTSPAGTEPPAGLEAPNAEASSSRCNGESPAPPPFATPTGDEQNG